MGLFRNRTWMIGFLCGVVCSLFAYASSFLSSLNPFNGMVVVIGFTYILLIGTWIGWRQGSRQRTILGAAVGLACGLAYLLLATYDYIVRGCLGVLGAEFITLFVTYPTVLSGVIAAVMGATQPLAARSLLAKFGKGALAGLVLGVLHFVLVFVFLIAGCGLHRLFGDYNPSTFPCVEAALALGCASALYFPLISWAVGLPVEGRSSAWVAKLTVWRVGIVLFVLMTIAGIVFSNDMPRF